MLAVWKWYQLTNCAYHKRIHTRIFPSTLGMEEKVVPFCEDDEYIIDFVSFPHFGCSDFGTVRWLHPFMGWMDLHINSCEGEFSSSGQFGAVGTTPFRMGRRVVQHLDHLGTHQNRGHCWHGNDRYSKYGRRRWFNGFTVNWWRNCQYSNHISLILSLGEHVLYAFFQEKNENQQEASSYTMSEWR